MFNFYRSRCRVRYIIQAVESISAPRPAWRQSLIDELNRRQFPGLAPARLPHPLETANRAALARDLARFLFSNGSGIPYADALRMGPSQWRLARQAVRMGRPAIPSRATIELALERLRELEASTVARVTAPNSTRVSNFWNPCLLPVAVIGNGLYCRIGRSTRASA